MINKVTDIIDIEYLQAVQDSLGRIMGVTTSLLNPDGESISRPTNLHSFCALMQTSEIGVQMCRETNKELIEISKRIRTTAVITCPNSGFKSAAVPIFLEDNFLGCWLIGQIRLDDIDYKLIEETTLKAGLPLDKAREYVSGIPVVTDEEFDNIINFLVTTTKTITDLVIMNDTLNKKNSDLSTLNNKLDASFATLKEFINLTDIGTYLVDYDTGQLIMCSNAYLELLGMTEEECLGRTCYSNLGMDDFCPACPKSDLLDENGIPTEPVKWEHFIRISNIWLSITSRAIRWIDGRMAILTTFMDITERKREEQKISYLAYMDQHLNIPNAVKLNVDINNTYSKNTYLIFFDVKGLKDINNVYGRPIGDALLMAISEWFSKYVDEYITFYRISGDDFAILLEQTTAEDAMNFAAASFNRFDSPWIVNTEGIDQRVYAGIQIGVIQISNPVDSHSTLLNLGEKVISFARKANKPIFFDNEMDEEHQKHTKLFVSLKSCVLNHMEGFSVNYQPVVEADSGKWVSIEALCRWNSPDVGIIPPNIFIEAAEQLGIISSIDSWVLEEAVSQTKRWELDKISDFSLSVNISSILLRDRGLVTKILDILEKYDYPTSKFSLEITETVEVQFNDTTLKLLSEIEAAGIQLSLDDFGTGYATFSNLRNLPVNTLKTDRSFINGIEEDEYLQHTMRIIVDFAHSAGLKVTAEGVETARQHEIIKQNGANYIQGFYFSKPLTKDDLEKNLNNFKK